MVSIAIILQSILIIIMINQIIIVIIFLIIIIILLLIMIISTSPLSVPLWAQLQICKHCSARQTSSCNPDHRHHDRDDDSDDDNGFDDDKKKSLSPVDNRACSDHLLRKSCRINCTWV